MGLCREEKKHPFVGALAKVIDDSKFENFNSAQF